MSLVHVSSTANCSDGLSRSRAGEDHSDQNYMTTEEAKKITDILIIPKNFSLTEAELKSMLEATPLPSFLKNTLKKKKATVKTIPLGRTMPEKRIERKIKPVAVYTPTRNFFNNYRGINEKYGKDSKEEVGKQDNNEAYSFATEITEMIINSRIIQKGAISIEDMITLQELDEKLNELQTEETENGLKFVVMGNEKKIALPLDLGKQMIYQFHFSLKGAHATKNAIKRKIEQNYFLPNISEISDSMIGGCQICQLAIVPRIAKYPFYQERIEPPARSRYFLDLFSGLPKSHNNYKFVILAVERLTSYTIASPAKYKNEEEIKRFILNLIVSHNGLDSLVVDHETAIMSSRAIEEFLNIYEIKKITVPLNASWNNSAEVRVSQIKENLRKLILQCDKDWVDLLGHAVRSINRTPMAFEDIRVSPEVALFGSARSDTSEPLIIREASVTNEAYFDSLISKMKEIQENVSKKKEDKAKRNQEYMNQRTREKDFQVNDLVVYRNLRIEKGMATKLKLFGPCIILKLDKRSAMVQNLVTKQVCKIHFSYLHKFRGENVNNLPPMWERDILREINRRPLVGAQRIYPAEIPSQDTLDEENETQSTQE